MRVRIQDIPLRRVHGQHPRGTVRSMVHRQRELSRCRCLSRFLAFLDRGRICGHLAMSITVIIPHKMGRNFPFPQDRLPFAVPLKKDQSDRRRRYHLHRVSLVDLLERTTTATSSYSMDHHRQTGRNCQFPWSPHSIHPFLSHRLHKMIVACTVQRPMPLQSTHPRQSRKCRR